VRVGGLSKHREVSQVHFTCVFTPQGSGARHSPPPLPQAAQADRELCEWRYDYRMLTLQVETDAQHCVGKFADAVFNKE
jgi:hypothetical protein